MSGEAPALALVSAQQPLGMQNFRSRSTRQPPTALIKILETLLARQYHACAYQAVQQRQHCHAAAAQATRLHLLARLQQQANLTAAACDAARALSSATQEQGEAVEAAQEVQVVNKSVVQHGFEANSGM